jgi:hypothetical protein
MTKFFQSQLDFVFLFYGLAFVILAAVCLGGKRGKDAIPWHWLGLFGLAHGLNEWLDLVALAVGDHPAFSAIRIAVMIGSFLFLVEFGRATLASLSLRTPGRWIIVPLFALACWGGWLWGWPGLNAASRYALGFVGGGASAVALMLASRRSPPGARIWLMLCGVTLGLYTLAAGIVVPRADFFPASVLHQDSFLQTLGFPVQLLRGILAVCIASAFWKYYRAMQNASPEGRHLQAKASYAALLPVALVVVLTGGWIVAELAGQSKDAESRRHVLSRAKTAAAAIDFDCVKSL